MRIVMIGGHLTPALATMDALSGLRGDIRFSFIGRMYAMEGDNEPSTEYRMMRERGIAFYPIKAGRLQRRFSKHTIPSLLRVPVGLFQSLQILRQIKPEVVVSFGGYVAVPVALAAWLLRIPVVTHEQTLIPGLANRIVACLARVMALSFEETRKYYEGSLRLVAERKIVVTGNPLRREVFELRGSMPFGGIDLPMVYVTCGNQGSHFVNQLVFRNVLELLPFCCVYHQTGKNSIVDDYGQSQRLMDSLPAEYAGRYLAQAYVGPDEIGAVFARAELVISRAGVNTLCDLLALGKKGIMIPGHKEQEVNAKFFAKTGLGKYLMPAAAENGLVQMIREGLALKVRSDVVQQAKQINKAEAAESVAHEILRFVR